jgi:hypothetical protein
MYGMIYADSYIAYSPLKENPVYEMEWRAASAPLAN